MISFFFFTGHSDIFIITETEVIRCDLEKDSSYSFEFAKLVVNPLATNVAII